LTFGLVAGVKRARFERKKTRAEYRGKKKDVRHGASTLGKKSRIKGRFSITRRDPAGEGTIVTSIMRKADVLKVLSLRRIPNGGGKRERAYEGFSK